MIIPLHTELSVINIIGEIPMTFAMTHTRKIINPGLLFNSSSPQLLNSSTPRLLNSSTPQPNYSQMNPDNQTLLLRDETISPSDAVLEQALGKELFTVYQALTANIKQEFDLNTEWRFYKDGQAWLCKVTFKKKTIFWLSIWENSIKTGFYFTEKSRMDVLELEIDNKIKEAFSNAKPIGKLIPLTIDIEQSEQLKDLWAIVAYKKGSF